MSQSDSSSSTSVVDVEQLGNLLRKNVVITDRKYRFTTHKQCFVGSEAVDYLMASKHAASRQDAVTLGQALVEDGIIEHVHRDHGFKDEELFYHFVNESSRGTVKKSDDGSRVRWSDFLDPVSLQSPSSPHVLGGKKTEGMLPKLPLPDFEAVPPESVHVASTVWPLDEHNLKLLDNVHPAEWEDPKESPGVYHLVVIGAGAGGLITAGGAAGVGAKVALIEANSLGGDCLNVGCVPSKALIHAANLAHTLRNKEALEESGISITGGEANINVDFAKTMERLRRIRAGISEHDSAERYTKKLGVDVYIGYGKFTSEKTVVVNGKTLEFKRAVVATGGYPSLIPMDGLKELYMQAENAKSGDVRPAVMTNETVFNLTALPARMGVIGTGVIGMELAQAMQRLGSQVTVFGRSGAVLPKEDTDLADVVKNQMLKDGVEFLLDVDKYNSVSMTGNVSENGHPELSMKISLKNGEEREFLCDALLIAAGRKPNVTGMDLEKANIKYDSKLGLTVNDQLQTTNPKVYGVGDCCSAYKFTHAADFMARMVIRNALFLGRARFSSLLIPYATFTAPEIAHVGLYESDLRERGIAFKTFEKRFEDNDRAICDSETDGLVRIHVEEKSDRIVGASIVGAGAGNMISEITLAMQSGTGLGKLAAVIHPYPTTAEAIRQTGDLYNRERLTPTTKGLLRGVLMLQR